MRKARKWDLVVDASSGHECGYVSVTNNERESSLSEMCAVAFNIRVRLRREKVVTHPLVHVGGRTWRSPIVLAARKLPLGVCCEK